MSASVAETIEKYTMNESPKELFVDKSVIEATLASIDVWLLIFGAVAFIGAAGSTVFGIRHWSNSRKLQAIQEVEDRQRELQITEAIARAAEANEKAEQERLARVQIEESLAGRRLDEEAQAFLVSELTQFSGQRVTSWVNVGDHEGFVFASDIAIALQLAKWDVFAPATVANFAESGSRRVTAIETGIVVAGTEDEASKNASDALVAALSSLGFDSRKSEKFGKNSVPVVSVDVETRPQGPQGKAKLRKGQ